MSESVQSQPDGGPKGATIKLAGVQYQRIPFGTEFDHWSKIHGACPDCATLQGEYHEFPCDIEECATAGAFRKRP